MVCKGGTGKAEVWLARGRQHKLRGEARSDLAFQRLLHYWIL